MVDLGKFFGHAANAQPQEDAALAADGLSEPEQPAFLQLESLTEIPAEPHETSLEEFEQLLAQQEALNARVEAARKQLTAQVIVKMRSQIVRLGITAADLGFVLPPADRNAHPAAGNDGKAAPKYRDPVTGRTWTGWGRAPVWIKNKDRQQFVIP